MNEKEKLKKMLSDIIFGLRLHDYTEYGGSDVFYILKDPKGNEVKLFLNNYDDPSHIVVRYSTYDSIQHPGD